MAEEIIAVTPQASSPQKLPEEDYTATLLQRASLDGSISNERAVEIRDDLAKAVSERAFAFTKGRSTTVTKEQAEDFWKSVFYQLDVVLLALRDDNMALDALRTRPVSELLAAGETQIIGLYEGAKEHFRAAYAGMKPYITMLFSSLVDDFAEFCKNYDARFHARDLNIAFIYPLMGGHFVENRDLRGVYRYYLSLRHESAILAQFPQSEVRTLLRRYAEKYLTKPDLLAENITEIVLLHGLCSDITGCPDHSLALKPDTPQMLEDFLDELTVAELAEKLREVMRKMALGESDEDLAYALAGADYFAERLMRTPRAENLEALLVY